MGNREIGQHKAARVVHPVVHGTTLSHNIANLEMRDWRRNIMSAFGAR